MIMSYLQDFVNSLNLNDLQELSSGEKKEVWKLLTTIGQSTFSTESAYTNSSKLMQKTDILQQVKDVKETFIAAHSHALRASGLICKSPKDYSQESKNRSKNNTEAILLSNLKDIGLEYSTPTPGDGNCFFEAVSDQLKRLGLPPQNAHLLRTNIVQFCKENYVLKREDGRVHLKDFVPGGNLDAYLQKMLQQGEWADHIIVMCMAAYLQRDIIVITSSPNTNPDDNILWISSGNAAGDPLCLGHIWENHYQSLRPIVTCSYSGTSSSNDDSFKEPKVIPKNSDEYVELTEDSLTNYVEDEPFVNFVKSKYCKNSRTNVHSTIRRIRDDGDEDDVIVDNLIHLDLMSKGIFSKHHKNRTTIQYKCERSRKPAGKNKGPKQTRANDCRAYVSFQFVSHKSKKAVIIRKQLQHNGHDINNDHEKHFNRPDPSLIAYIESLLDQGKKQMDILCKVWRWARDQGKYDIHDRRYYLTPVDVKNICQRYKSNKRLHQNDAVAVNELCTQVLTDEIIFYQELIQETQPLIIVYQNSTQRERMKEVARNVVFLDATYKGLTAYGYVFYALVARNEQNRGTPLAYCIASEDNSDLVKTFLTAVKKSASTHGYVFCPRSFMVDRDQKEISAISTVFPDSTILLCWFHVLQAIYRFLNKKESGISGNQHATTRKKVVEYIRSMRLCATKEEFMNFVGKIHEEMPTEDVTKYLETHWCNEKWGPFWSNYGRHFFHEDQETNNLVERFFLGIKYHFLGGYNNHRIEDLLLLLHENVTTFYDYMDELAKCGRLKNARALKNQRGKLVAENMLRAGMDKNIQWVTETKCRVPSQSSPDKLYDVDIVNINCNCPASAQGGLCKHIHLGKMAAVLKNIDLDKEKIVQADLIYNLGQYHHDKDNEQVEIVSLPGSVSIVNLATQTCSCFANSHGIQCVCTIVANMVAPQYLNPCSVNIEVAETELKEPNESLDQKVRQKLQAVNLVVNSLQFKEVSEQRKRSILQSLNAIYSSCIGTNFHKKTTKRKQQPLFPNRKAKKIKEDHPYTMTKRGCKSNNSNKKEDGSFKMSARKKGSTRNTFQ